MKISLRLSTIVNEIEFDTLADIGTDHGYIPIFASKKGIIKSAIACDINKEPLSVANRNITSYGLQNEISCRLGSGLSPLMANEVETVTIGGMGGKLISSILYEDISITNSIKQLILQPQNGLYNLRRNLHMLGFKIKNEIIIKEDKFYIILNCLKGYESGYTDLEYRLGKYLLINKSEIFKDYLFNEINNLNDIYVEVSKSNDYNKKTELTNIINSYGEVYKCL